MAPQTWWRKHLTVRKVIFYVLFHGFHIGLFVFGWYVASRSPLMSETADDADIGLGGSKRRISASRV